jgi:cupin 2 domain-containing protein
MRCGNLRDSLSGEAGSESFETLAARPGVRVERIVSCGLCASPPGFWYEQDEAEWVLLVSGEAVLRFEEGDRELRLRPGDWVDIAPGERHRVEWTREDGETVWVGVFY